MAPDSGRPGALSSSASASGAAGPGPIVNTWAHELTMDVGVANSVDISADQQVVAVGANNKLSLLRLSDKYRTLEEEEMVILKDTKHGGKSVGMLKPVLKVKFNPTLELAHVLATTSSSGAVGIWDINAAKGSPGQWKPDTVLREHSQAVGCLAWHYNDSETLLTGSNDRTIKFWDIRVKSHANFTITPKQQMVRDLQFRKEQATPFFAAAFSNGVVQVWDVRHNSKAVHTYRAHQPAEALSVDWNPEVNHLLASGGSDGWIKVWDTAATTSAEEEHNADTKAPPASSTGTSSSAEESLGGGSIAKAGLAGSKDASPTKLLGSARQRPAASERAGGHLRRQSGESQGSIKSSVTDASAAEKRRGKGRKSHSRPLYEFVADDQVMRARWRPGHPYQIVASSLKTPYLKLWNVVEPHVPLTTILACELDDSANGFLWLDTFLDPNDIVGSTLYSTVWWSGQEDEEIDLLDDANGSEYGGDTGSVWNTTGQLQDPTNPYARLPGNRRAPDRNRFTPIDAIPAGEAPPSQLNAAPPGANSDVARMRRTHSPVLSAMGARRAPSPTHSLAESVMTHRTNSALRAGNEYNHESNLEQQKAQQRKRFRKFRHRHRSEEASKLSWGSLLCCSAGGKVTIRCLAKGNMPLQKFRSNAISFSVKSRLAAVFEQIPSSRLEDALMVNRLLEPEEQTSRPVNKVNVLGAPRSTRDMPSAGPGGSFSDPIFGFNAEQFIALAQGYVTPSTLRESPEGMRLLEEHRIRHLSLLGAGTQSYTNHYDANTAPSGINHVKGTNEGGRAVSAPQASAAELLAPPVVSTVDGVASAQTAYRKMLSQPYGAASLDAHHDTQEHSDFDEAHEKMLLKQAALTACCEHNAGVAVAAGARTQAQIWRLIMMQYAPQSVHLDAGEKARQVFKVAEPLRRSRTLSFDSHSSRDTFMGPVQRANSHEPEASGPDDLFGLSPGRSRSGLGMVGGGLPTSPRRHGTPPPAMSPRGSALAPKHLRTHSASSASRWANALDAWGPGPHLPMGRLRVHSNASRAQISTSSSGANSIADEGKASSDHDSRGGLGGGGGQIFEPKVPGHVRQRSGSVGVDSASSAGAAGSMLEDTEADAEATERIRCGLSGSGKVSVSAQEVDLSTPFSIGTGRTQLWRPESINLLCRLSRAVPVDDANFVLRTKTLEDDVQELHDAIEFAKPLVPEKPMSKGHQKLRRFHRMQRRRKFVQYYQQIYSTQMQLQVQSPVSGPVATLAVFEPTNMIHDGYAPSHHSSLQEQGAQYLEFSRSSSLSSGHTFESETALPEGGHRHRQRALTETSHRSSRGSMNYGDVADARDDTAEDEVSRQLGVGQLDRHSVGAMSAADDIAGLDRDHMNASIDMGGGVRPSDVDSVLLNPLSGAPPPLSWLGMSEHALEKGEVILSPLHIVTQNTSKLKSDLVHDILEHHADNGDVQTCSMLLLVLGDLLEPEVDSSKKRMWLCSYVDLLQQLRVFSVAARVISACNDPEVERCYQMSSMVAEGCSFCFQTNKKNLIMADTVFTGICETCKHTVSRCAICEQVVKGVYVWCQGCGHAGHLDHMTEWFRTEKTCPTGCGHNCTLSDIRMLRPSAIEKPRR